MIWTGTSGYNYPEWKGSFYPADLAAAKMLPYYAARFPTVEINYTFYRMPNEKIVSGWAAQTPSPYKLTLKAPRRITHDSRLKQVGEHVQAFCQVAGTLGDKLGALLFQLPPNLKKDVDRFRGFIGLLPADRRYVFEFRHESWFDDEVYDAMRERDIAMCVAEQDDFRCPVVSTASWGYLRLHKLDYQSTELVEWASCVTGQQWKEAYVFFKHDETENGGSGPPAVGTFVAACGM
jgi:uncharacterized protein YecE (DUF72 family)